MRVMPVKRNYAFEDSAIPSREQWVVKVSVLFLGAADKTRHLLSACMLSQHAKVKEAHDGASCAGVNADVHCQLLLRPLPLCVCVAAGAITCRSGLLPAAQHRHQLIT